MGGWSIFQHTCACDVVTDPAGGTPYRIGGQAAAPGRRQIRAHKAPGERERKGNRVAKPARRVPRKAASLSARVPYRERTHVVKESILR